MKFLVVLSALVAISSAQVFGRAQSRGAYQGFRTAATAPAAAYQGFRAAAAAPAAAAFQGFRSAAAVPAAAAYQGFAAAAAAPRAAAVVASRVASSDQAANILRSESDINPDGTYSYAYETDNGIAAQVQGSAGGASGSFSWTSVEGQPIGISFVADENGYQPSGDAIPTPPPVPPQIARSLEWLARNAPPQPQQF